MELDSSILIKSVLTPKYQNKMSHYLYCDKIDQENIKKIHKSKIRENINNISDIKTKNNNENLKKLESFHKSIFKKEYNLNNPEHSYTKNYFFSISNKILPKKNKQISKINYVINPSNRPDFINNNSSVNKNIQGLLNENAELISNSDYKLCKLTPNFLSVSSKAYKKIFNFSNKNKKDFNINLDKNYNKSEKNFNKIKKLKKSFSDHPKTLLNSLKIKSNVIDFKHLQESIPNCNNLMNVKNFHNQSNENLKDLLNCKFLKIVNTTYNEIEKKNFNFFPKKILEKKIKNPYIVDRIKYNENYLDNLKDFSRTRNFFNNMNKRNLNIEDLKINDEKITINSLKLTIYSSLNKK